LFGQVSLHPDIKQNPDGTYYLEQDGKKMPEEVQKAVLTLRNCQGSPKVTEKGIAFDFKEACPSGTLYYGFIPMNDSKHPLPVYFKRVAEVKGGKTEIQILDNLSGKYDMIQWEKNGKGIIGYRLETEKGEILYDGKIGFRFKDAKLSIDVTITEGPFVANHTAAGVTIVFNTNLPVKASVKVGETEFAEALAKTRHEIVVSGLEPDKKYDYNVQFGENTQTFSFKTAPEAGAKTPFRFAYCSDSRNGNGGGERNVYGANFYIVKKIGALATMKETAFMQFSGDMINGYRTNKEEMLLQYANWKRALEPFMHYMPVYVTMGNHEALTRNFKGSPDSKYYSDDFYSVDRFPYETESAEAVFRAAFVNPENGLESEDGASYDPNPDKIDFPSYKESVFYYTHGNVAMIVLNSNYFYAPSTQTLEKSSGGLHAYIMNQQLAWFKKTVQQFEDDPNIDHIFVSQHTPYFPNGGHVDDDMWYNGQNSFRTFVAGKPLEKGIIERRDELLDIVVNKSQKVRAILTGDEHNYAVTKISPDMPIYPEDWSGERLKLNRVVYQVNNGAAGAPYYAQETTPWSDFVSGFTTQNALVFFDVDGKSIKMEVLNPDTLEKVHELDLTK
ncbi:MAG: metallophosphoesterase, partial [Bacteroidota bacterium]